MRLDSLAEPSRQVSQARAVAPCCSVAEKAAQTVCWAPSNTLYSMSASVLAKERVAPFLPACQGACGTFPCLSLPLQPFAERRDSVLKVVLTP